MNQEKKTKNLPLHAKKKKYFSLKEKKEKNTKPYSVFVSKSNYSKGQLSDEKKVQKKNVS